MAWTPEEVASVRAAVLALVTGTRAVSVSYAGPPARSVTYAMADLPGLRSLLEGMELGAAVPGPTYRRATFSKGFDPSSGSSG